MRPKAIAFSQIAFLALAVALFFWLSRGATKPPTDVATTVATTTQVELFPKIEIEAKAAYIFDMTTGKALYEKDAQLQLPLASLTKLMSALTASKLVPDYHLVRITPNDLREEGDTGLYPNEEWNIQKLIDFSLVVSSNDGMRAIASVAGLQVLSPASTTPQLLFVDEMNKHAYEIGLTETYFLNQSGLDVTKTLSGGYGSAKDVSLLVSHILTKAPNLLEATSLGNSVISSNDFAHSAINTNKAMPNIPNVIASKTGYTDLSGGNVVVAWNAGINHPIIIAVLGSSYEGRFRDLTTLVNATLEYLSSSTTSAIPPLAP